MAEAAEHGHRGTVERRLEARPVGLVAERRRRRARSRRRCGRRPRRWRGRGWRSRRSRPERSAGGARHLGDDLLADRVDLLVGQRPLASAAASPRSRATSCRRRARRSRRRRRPTPRDQLRGRRPPRRGRRAPPRRRGRRRRRSRAGPAAGRTAPAAAWSWSPAPCGSGIASRISSKPASGPSTSSASSDLRVELAEGADAPSSAPGGWCPSGRDGTRPAPRRRPAPCPATRPSASRSASASALASNAETGAALADQWRPLPSTPARAAADAGGGDRPDPPAGRRDRSARPRTGRDRRSRGRRCAAPRRSGRAAGSAACRTCRRRSDWRAPAPASPPPKASAALVRDERPGHRLDQAARGERALGAARAGLDRRQHRLAARRAARGSGATGTWSTPMMRTISSTRSALIGHVRPPGRHRHGDACLGAVRLAGEAERLEDCR